MGAGFRLKSALKYEGITIKELSKRTGISINTLYSITKRDSERVNPDILKRISNATGIDRFYLLFGFKGPDENDLPYSDFLDMLKASRTPGTPINKFLDALDEALGPDPFDTESAQIIRVPIPDKYNDLISAFSCLNEDGQIKAVERVRELTEIPRYQKQHATKEDGEQPVNPRESPLDED